MVRRHRLEVVHHAAPGGHPACEMMMAGTRSSFSFSDSSTELTTLAALHIIRHCSTLRRCCERWRW